MYNPQEFTWRSNNVVVRGSHCMYEENQPSRQTNLYCCTVSDLEKLVRSLNLNQLFN